MDAADSPSSSSSHEQHGAACPPPAPPRPKRPAGRTKFKETRHPVYRGVRRRGPAGRWVCEVRVPGKRGQRLWLGTHLTADSAARAHDAAMLALRGPFSATACHLNFPDSAWLLAMPCVLPSDLAAVRRAALAAVADFQRREVARGDATVPVVEDIASSATALPSYMDDASSWAASFQPCEIGNFDVPVGMFELDMAGEMDLGVYYADLAEGLLMEPPQMTPDTEACWEIGYYSHGGAEATLWNY
ncbi:dehydration-responsive element-binding protein 1H [Brachypodium distachyon]|uniref:CBF1 n=1 Tax=Brachypodium distachyon TaxID=15368 RepID=H9C1H0_BRADI|nr:dehydration-responsive element-binding protein 1H [Brachypodium distachyon]AFD96407.1 CBF1 [Brachypodium distachyon]KQJ91103.1 hypothetical protein BRADI_4g35570v3 [Brachypodium distachyon]|eukprot:XP_010238393.1 dehydration-responsive element-binding protein 1H [Brachypodium distachyon]